MDPIKNGDIPASYVTLPDGTLLRPCRYNSCFSCIYASNHRQPVAGISTLHTYIYSPKLVFFPWDFCVTRRHSSAIQGHPTFGLKRPKMEPLRKDGRFVL